MHGVPANLDLRPFVGASLDQIRLGAWDIQFHFSGPKGCPSASLGVEGRWAVFSASGEVIDESLRDDQAPEERAVYRVHRLLGHSVVAFTLDPPTSLTLTFDDGSRLTVWDDESGYESFHVEPGGYHI